MVPTFAHLFSAENSQAWIGFGTITGTLIASIIRQELTARRAERKLKQSQDIVKHDLELVERRRDLLAAQKAADLKALLIKQTTANAARGIVTTEVFADINTWREHVDGRIADNTLALEAMTSILDVLTSRINDLLRKQ
jgi:hypothetical protein